MFNIKISLLVLITFVSYGCSFKFVKEITAGVTLEGTGAPSNDEIKPQIKYDMHKKIKLHEGLIP